MALKLYGGRKARAEIQEHGFSAQRISMMIGASGGPKWLMLSRLDQYISEHLLPSAKQPIHLLGSSIGSWRMACYAQPDPLTAFKRFEDIYINQRYESLTPELISIYANKVLDTLFDEGMDQAVVTNPNRILHIVAARNRKLFNSANRVVQGISVALAATLNLISSQAVAQLYPRVVVSQGASAAPYEPNKQTVELTVDNLKQALLASGAIPLVLEPSLIEGGEPRWHWDGGLVDYHFAGPFDVQDGFVFYPHFFPKIIPGWFDKALPWRRLDASAYDNVVLVTPSIEFINSLPYGKIPDRKDFTQLSNDDREAYWHTVLDRTQELVEDFDNMLNKDGGRNAIEPIDAL